MHYGLFRTSYSHNPAPYSHIVISDFCPWHHIIKKLTRQREKRHVSIFVVVNGLEV